MNPLSHKGRDKGGALGRSLRTSGNSQQSCGTRPRARSPRWVGSKASLIFSATILIFYGCSNEPSNNPSTHAEFTETVQAICRHYNTKAVRVAERLVRFTDPAPKTAKIADLTGQELERLRTVQPLNSDANGYAEFLSGENLIRDGWLRAADLAQREDNHFVIALKLDDYRSMSLSAMRLGLDDCATEFFVKDYRALEGLPADRRAFVDQGDAICRAADEAKAELYVRLEDYFPPYSFAKFAEATAQFAEIMRKEIDDLRKLVPPGEDRTQMATTLDGYGNSATRLQLAQRAAEKRDSDTYHRYWDEVRGNLDEYDKVLRTYGFQQCGWLRAFTISQWG